MRPVVVCGLAGGALAVGVQLGRALQRRSSRSRAEEAQAEAARPDAPRELQPPACVPASAPAADAQETRVMDGKAIAEKVRIEMKQAAEQLYAEHKVKPGLAVVLVGTRKDSETYVRMKKKAAMEANFHSVDVVLPETVSQVELLAEVHKLNADSAVHAILVQLPLPAHIDEPAVLKAIKVEKDVDGFSALNIGNLVLKGGDPPLAIPCTPAGCVELLQRSGVDVRGKHAVVLGRSNIVGMPVAALLQSMDATVTVCHSRTQGMADHVRRADLIIAAIGKPEFVRGDWLKPGCIVIDVGINAVDDASKKLGHRLVGDVNYAEAQGIASLISPVPGGVGPMTIAMLLKNTINLARLSIGLPRLPLRNTSTKAAKAAATALPSEQDYAVVVVPGGASADPWASAVKAAALRERVQTLASAQAPPAVVLEASSCGNGAPPVSLIAFGSDGSRAKVVCSGASFEEAATHIGGA
mmetsp:Transcript_113125/g.314928  ORF Transcript_113125/g.314928 Transcript_113125/m.314928 type:complete len:469 (-) Transcript_113125:47-1453(-)